MTQNEFISLLEIAAKSYGIDINNKQLEMFYKYKNILTEVNMKMNLTAITDENEIIYKHFIDSMMIVSHIRGKKNFIDVGTGAGFPGIPVKIMLPETEVVLVDSLAKRINFLRELTDALDLKDITALHRRAEDLGRESSYREKFDCSAARAVAPLAVLLEYCIPFVKVGGIFISMKGNNVNNEIITAKNALKELGCIINMSENINMQEVGVERSIIILKKNRQTSSKYPRKSGIPAKKPI